MSSRLVNGLFCNGCETQYVLSGPSVPALRVKAGTDGWAVGVIRPNGDGFAVRHDFCGWCRVIEGL